MTSKKTAGLLFGLLAALSSSARAQEDPRKSIPSRFDWRDRGIMMPVKHQMNLGSCGVFAAVAVFESLIKKETGKTVDLSEQQVITK